LLLAKRFNGGFPLRVLSGGVYTTQWILRERIFIFWMGSLEVVLVFLAFMRWGDPSVGIGAGIA
jgi:hypothetical protein